MPPDSVRKVEVGNQAEGRETHHLDVDPNTGEGKPPLVLVGEADSKVSKHTTSPQRSSSCKAQECEDNAAQTSFDMPSLSAMRKPELVAAIKALGEELLPNGPLMELEEEKGNRGRVYTNLQMWTIRLNEAAKRKEDLKTFLREELQVAVSNNSTIAQLTKQGMEKIYVITTPSGSDPMGFGENSNMTYDEVKTQRADYRRWAIKTAKQGATGVRLGRFVRWLEMGDQEQNAMDVTRPAPPKMRTTTTMTTEKKKEEQDSQGYPDRASQASGSASTAAWMQTHGARKSQK